MHRRTTRCRPARALAPAVLALAMLVTACADDDATEEADDTSEDATEDDAGGTSDEDPTADASDEDATDEGSDGDFPLTIESDGGTWTLDDAPERIVSLSPMATEVLFAIGAGDQVVAADEFSTYPEEAPTTDLSGIEPNVEAVTAYDPDLVIIVNDANDLVASLTSLEIPVLVSSAPTDIESGYDIMAELGVATGQVDRTDEVVSDLREDIDAALAEAPETAVRVYHELDENFYAASSYGFVGDVYEQMGASNIADEADPDQSGFPQLTEEFIVDADPELIVITDQVDYTADDVAERSGWQDITAVDEGNIVTVDADVASRWGPRLPQFITTVAEASAAVTADDS
jgi:iron complex transport system substrate-binding protein